MLDLSPTAVVARVDESIVAALDAALDSIAPLGAHADDLLGPLAAASRGGKRLRAQLLVTAHAAHGGSDVAVFGAAAAVEWFQTAALIHDDVLDGSDTRRGAPAAHRRFEALHRDRGLDGDAGAFGSASAILAGDIALMIAQRALAYACAPHPDGARAMTLFAEMAELCTAGQYLDMRIAAEPLDALDGLEDQILATMRSKTASYSCEHPLAIGAALAGATDAQVQAMREIGVPLGIAFQLRDDVLGLVGDPAVTGKPAGDDVREGKRTLLIQHAWTHGDGATRDAVRAALGVEDIDAAALARAVDAITASGALEAAESRIDALARPALDALAALELEATARDRLLELGRRLTARDA